MSWGEDRLVYMVHISHRELIDMTEVVTAARYVVNRGDAADIQRLEVALKLLDRTKEQF